MKDIFISSCCNQGGCQAKGTLIIIGGGSAAFSAATRAVELGAEKVTIINDGLPTGGTCVDVGCVPSKTLIRAAESLHRSNHNPFAGIVTSGRLTDFAAVIQDKRRLVTELRQAKYVDVIRDVPNVHLENGHAKLLDSHTVELGPRRLAADNILIATGASAAISEIPGLAASGYLTNESAFELETLPESLIVLGGRYIALECAQMFARMGSGVTVLQRSDRILPIQPADITDALTGYLVGEGLEILTGVTVQQVVSLSRFSYRIQGMDCKACAAGLQAMLGRLPGVTTAVVSYRDGTAQVQTAPAFHPHTVIRTLDSVGYNTTLMQPAKLAVAR
ncbi:MAG: FAD-dependent oxidoreductase [Phycisphaerae bacterium]|nr:FAD-dependent oxidoreductase [Phycisphaerae bacterium]